MASLDLEYTAAYYDRYAQREAERWKSPRGRIQYAIFEHHIRSRVGRNDRVLDAGCGPGTWTEVLLDIGCRVSCVDLSSVQLDLCRQRTPGADAYHVGSITDLPFEDRSFDVSLALGGVISYCFEQAADAVDELVRVAKPGGVLGISVMNLFGSIHQYFPAVAKQSTDTNRNIVSRGDLSRRTNDGHECHLFRPNELRSLLEAAGVTDVGLHADGWLAWGDETALPPVGSEAWKFLVEVEMEASAESPAAGTHIIAWGRAPT